MKTFYQWFFSATCLIIMAFGVTKYAEASCIYNIDRFDTGSQSQLKPGDKVNFFGKLSRELKASSPDELGDCSNDYVTLSIQIQGINVQYFNASFDGLSGLGTAYKLNFTPDKSNPNLAHWDFTASGDLKFIPSDQLAKLTKLTFSFSVTSNNFPKVGSAKSNWTVPFTYSGAVPGPPPSEGVKNLSLEVLPSNVIFKPGQSFSVTAGLSQPDANLIISNPNIGTLIMETRINGYVVGSYKFDKGDLSYGKVKQEKIIVNTSQFKDGYNDLVVNLIEDNTKVVIATQQGRVDAIIPGAVQVTIVGGPKAIYALGEAITLSAQNLPGNGTYQLFINGKTFSKGSANDLNGFKIIVNEENFELQKNNNIEISVYAPDGVTEIFNNHLAKFSIGDGPPPGPGGGNPPPGSGGGSGTEGDCEGPNPDPTKCFFNPLPVNSLTETLLLIMRGFLMIIGIWAAVFIVIGGFRLVMSQGNEEAVSAAKKTITWAVIGLAVAILSVSIIAIVQNILQVRIPENIKDTNRSSQAPMERSLL